MGRRDSKTHLRFPSNSSHQLSGRLYLIGVWLGEDRRTKLHKDTCVKGDWITSSSPSRQSSKCRMKEICKSFIMANLGIF